MKALFKHLSAISEGEPGTVVNKTSRPHKNISSPFISTTLLAVLLGVPQIPIIGSHKAIAQTTGSCPAGTAPEEVRLRTSDNLSDLTQEYNIGGVRTIFTFTEQFPGEVIDRSESRVDDGIYGGIQGPDLRLNIGPGKPPETGNLAEGSAIVTITFDQAITLESALTLLDVDRNGERDRGRIFQDVVTVTASNGGNDVPVSLQALGPFTRINGNTAFGQVENSRPENGDGNVSVTPGGAVDQIRIEYQPGREFGPPGQDQTIGLAPFTICAPLPGTIGDTVYRDNNSNGVQDGGDTGIPDVTVNLINLGPDGEFGTDDDTTEGTTTTDENGIYTFSNVPTGNYRVTTTTPDGLTPTQTQPDTINLEPGQNRDDIDFGFSPQQLGSIGDTVYRDNNSNSVQDDGDTGIPDVTVNLITAGPDGEFGTGDDVTENTTTTDENGIYTFSNLTAGSYRVTTTTPDGLTPTQTQPDTVNLEPGQNIDTVDFGFSPQQLGSIGDTVYRDNNSNSVQDDGDTGIPDVTVNLITAGPDGEFGTGDDVTENTTTTDENGIYTFSNLPAGSYRVTTTTPDGLTPTQTQPDTVNLEPGQNIDTVDFGFSPQQLGSIGDTVYTDGNNNNIQDQGEFGREGVTVTLTLPGADGQLDTGDDTQQTTITDENGNYTFSNLPPGDYRVTVETPEDFTATQIPPDTVTLEPGQNRDDIDFGFTPQRLGSGQGSIGDTVYNDINGNGQQDPGEPGIPNVIVNYAGAGDDGVFGESLDDDDTSGNTRTDANGNYTFPNLPAGIYRVTINDQSQDGIRGLSQTQTPNNPITLNDGDSIVTADFGFTQSTGTIGDTVYRDNNSNSTQDQGEPGIAGVEVTLIGPGPDGNLGTNDDTTEATTTTDNNGRYIFTDVPLGNYRVTVNNPPQGLNPTQTPPNPVSLTTPNQNFDTADFGFSPQDVVTIGDFVFFDNDGDSTPDGNEIGIPGITLILRDTDGNEVARTTTDDNGFYNFTVPPGTYTVTVDNPPQGLNPTLTQNNPITLQAGQSREDIDFGFQPTAQSSIGDTVFADVNANRIQDPGEPGVSGVVVRLINPGDDGIFGNDDDQIQEQFTDNTQTVAFNDNTPGQYTFNNLLPGNYQVEIVLPDGSVLTTGNNPITVPLQANQNFVDADFGVRMTGLAGSIGDTVFEDTNGNGVQDDGEPGIPGIDLTLRDSQGTDIQTTTTDENGNYTFDNLPLDNFTVESDTPINFRLTTGNNPLSAELTAENPNRDDIDFGFQPFIVGEASPDGPVNFRLVKRVTRINDQTFTNFIDDPGDDDDGVINSQTPVRGIFESNQANQVRSNDIVEYTIYFLKEGADELQNVRFCDQIPQGTTLEPNSIENVTVEGEGTGDNAGQVILLSGLQSIGERVQDSQERQRYENACNSSQAESQGAILVNLGNLPSGIQTGFIRFRVRVN